MLEAYFLENFYGPSRKVVESLLFYNDKSNLGSKGLEEIINISK